MEKPSKTTIKKIRELLREKKARDESGSFIAEGFKIVSDVFTKGHDPVEVVWSAAFSESGKGGKLIAALEDRSVPVYRIGDPDFDALSSLQAAQGILAVIKKPRPAKPEKLGASDLFVVCDGIQDPGNMGSIIRTSAAFGVKAVLLINGCADVYNPKVVRASSGTIMDMPAHECAVKELDRLKKEGCVVLTAQAGGDAEHIEKLTLEKRPRVIVFGSEGGGISREASDKADTSFMIPISGKVESLNVNAAAAIVLYLLSRK